MCLPTTRLGINWRFSVGRVSLFQSDSIQKGSRGFYRVNMRHGVSRLKRGIRFALCVIYHDSQ